MSRELKLRGRVCIVVKLLSSGDGCGFTHAEKTSGGTRDSFSNDINSETLLPHDQGTSVLERRSKHVCKAHLAGPVQVLSARVRNTLTLNGGGTCAPASLPLSLADSSVCR